MSLDPIPCEEGIRLCENKLKPECPDCETGKRSLPPIWEAQFLVYSHELMSHG